MKTRDMTPFELLLRSLAAQPKRYEPAPAQVPVDVYISRALQRHDVYQYETQPRWWLADQNQ